MFAKKHDKRLAKFCKCRMTVIMSVLINISWLYTQVSIACLWIYVFNFLILITWIVGLLGVLKKNSTHAKHALYLWSAFILLWLFIVLSSFSEYGKSILCLECRCPESFWINNDTWHASFIDHEVILRPPTHADTILDDDHFHDHFHDHHHRHKKSFNSLHESRKKKSDHYNNENKNITRLIITFAINICILLFSWLILFNNNRIEQNKEPGIPNKKVLFKNSCPCP